MDKIFTFLDPRKSGDLTKKSDNNNSDKVIVSGINSPFPVNNWREAIKAAEALAAKSKSTVQVLFPIADIHVDKTVVIGDLIKLSGQVLNGSSAQSATKFVVEKGASISVEGAVVEITSLIVEGSHEKLITVGPNSSLSLVESVVSGKGGLTVNGKLKANGCLFLDSHVQMGKTATGDLSKTHFYESRKGESESGAAIEIFTESEIAVKLNECEIRDYDVGILLEGSRAKVELDGCVICVKKVAIDLLKGDMKINGGSFSATLGEAVHAKGSISSAVISNSSLVDSVIGISAREQSFLQLMNCEIKKMKHCALAVESSRVVVTDCKLDNAGLETAEEKSNAMEVTLGADVFCNKCVISNFSGSAIIVANDTTLFKFDDLQIVNSGTAGLCASLGAAIQGSNIQFTDNSGPVMDFRNEKTQVDMTVIRIKGGKVGIICAKGPYCVFKDVKMEQLEEKAVYILDSSVTINGAQVNQTQTNRNGIHVKFKGHKKDKVRLQDCKVHGCNEGIRVEQVGSTKEHKSKNDDPLSIPVTYGYQANSNDTESSCDIENAAFVQCEVGFYVNAAKVNLKGCSFIMNKKHSLEIENQHLRNGPQVRKEANLIIRWPNYVEPYIDNGDNVSNDHQLLTSVTKEKSFCGSADFEPIMYISTLTERIRQARTLFRSKEADSMPTARVIMRSVSHMLILLKQLTPRLLERELNDDPDLGMFAATFKLYEEKSGPTNTLVSMEALFASWRDLHRTRLFDQALQALNEAFQEKQVTEDLYDEWVTPLEEMQRVCFVKSKYNRRRDYLLTTAKENPLTTWYFLDKEPAHTEEGKRLREEVLKFLAADREDNRVHNKTNFHASWVGQWAVNLLGTKLINLRLPEDFALRKAWADALLDSRNPKKLLDEYDSRTIPQQHEYDELIKFEGLKMYESISGNLNATQIAKLTSVLGGNGFPAAMQMAAKFFKGEGALPGFLRRVCQESQSLEMLLDPLSNIQDLTQNFVRKQRDRVVLAMMSHYEWPDSQLPPEIYRRKGGYETCEMCLVQKLQPWNELKLGACKHNHRFCRPCMKLSMSQGQQHLWGICPGQTDDGKACDAVATRREMELAGMDIDLIYNILSKRITTKLSNIPNWKPCDAPECIGGRSNVTKSFYTCRLCSKLVTPDNGKSDPTVPKRLLQGLDGSAVTRGEGVFRECYWCAVTYEKGNACSTITCVNCKKQFSMTWGPEKITHRFDEEGVPPQRYIPRVPGKLWELGVYKDRKGNPLKLGQTLTEQEAAEVVRRAKLKLVEFSE